MITIVETSKGYAIVDIDEEELYETIEEAHEACGDLMLEYMSQAKLDKYKHKRTDHAVAASVLSGKASLLRGNKRYRMQHAAAKETEKSHHMTRRLQDRAEIIKKKFSKGLPAKD